MTESNKNNKGVQLTNPLQKGSTVLGCRTDENISRRPPSGIETYSKGDKKNK